jgi:hypothetical protein
LKTGWRKRNPTQVENIEPRLRHSGAECLQLQHQGILSAAELRL